MPRYPRLLVTLEPLLGQRLLTVTDEPPEDSLDEEGNAYVHLHFENGLTLRFPVGADGFEVLIP
jgi:hypothetical protein